MSELPVEHCYFCDLPTGKAGASEDSIYISWDDGDMVYVSRRVDAHPCSCRGRSTSASRRGGPAEGGEREIER